MAVIYYKLLFCGLFFISYKGSLGGGSRTSIIVNISPGKDVHGEVLNSLKFASRASKVKVVAKLTRVIDYESLYFAAQKELDNRNQIETYIF